MLSVPKARTGQTAACCTHGRQTHHFIKLTVHTHLPVHFPFALCVQYIAGLKDGTVLHTLRLYLNCRSGASPCKPERCCCTTHFDFKSHGQQYGMQALAEMTNSILLCTLPLYLAGKRVLKPALS